MIKQDLRKDLVNTSYKTIDLKSLTLFAYSFLRIRYTEVSEKENSLTIITEDVFSSHFFKN